jgi:ClpP class serine protease
MNFKLASAIFQGKLLIEPAYAATQLPLLVEMIKDQVSDRSALRNIRAERAASMLTNLPDRKAFTTNASLPVFSVTPYTSIDRLPYDSIVVIDIIGPVLKYGSWYGWGTVELNDLVIRMANSDRVKGIILNVDSPGGQAAGTADFAQSIRNVSKVKPVLAIVQDGIAASAAMWIISAAQETYLTQPTDQVGSIGAYNTIFDLTKYFEDMGVVYRDIYAPQSEDKNLDYRQAVEGNDTLIKEDLKFLVEHFIKAVKTNRGMRINEKAIEDRVNKEPFTGKMYNAAEAITLGLVDGIKPLAGVVARMEQLIKLRA